MSEEREVEMKVGEVVEVEIKEEDKVIDVEIEAVKMVEVDMRVVESTEAMEIGSVEVDGDDGRNGGV